MADRSRQIVVGVGVARVAMGAIVAARPALLARSFGVDSASAGRTGFVARMFAGREIGLGLGTALAGTRGGPAFAPWLVASALSDSLDAVGLVAAARERSVRAVPAYLAAALGVASVAAAAVALGTVREP